MNDMKPCPNPWCEGGEPKIVFCGLNYSPDAQKTFRVVCHWGCGLQGPIANTPEEARAKWEDRPETELAKARREVAEAAAAYHPGNPDSEKAWDAAMNRHGPAIRAAMEEGDE
jgi:hypothetical protein